MSPKVSIGLRSYNQKEYLREAIESVLMQDYENMEIVVADDASTDGTQDMLREYEQKHPRRFKIIFNEKNLGIGANSNVILSASTGKYIAWLDGDDLFLPGKIKQQVELLEKNPDGVVCYHNFEPFYESEPEIMKEKFGHGPVYGTEPGKIFPRQGGFENIVDRGFYVIPSTIMILRERSPQWDTRLRCATDMLYMFEAAIQGKFCYIPKVLTRYRRHENNITNTKSPDDNKIYLYMIYAILDAKYPQYFKHTRLLRDAARSVHHAAVQKILANQGKKARELLFESLRQGWVSWKWFGWYLRSFFSGQ